MRALFYDLQIDGKPILIPDADVQMEFSDLDSSESGRDERGFMHRIVLRRRVKTWSVPYDVLTGEEYRYMESLFEGKDEFTVDYRDGNGNPAKCVAYRSKHSITIHNAKKGIFKNYKFDIMEC